MRCGWFSRRPSYVGAEEAGAEAVVAEDEEIVDLGDDAPEIPPGDDENAFLEEEEGEADVSGIVGGDKAEET